MLEAFELIHAESIEHAIELKEKLGESASFYAGGTELLQVLKEGMLAYDHLVSLKRVPDMKKIEVDTENRILRIGAMATHSEIASSPIVQRYQPTFAKLEDRIGNIRIRKSGTIGGNLAFAEPRSDPGAFLVAVEGTVGVIGVSDSREIRMEDFWQGPFETALEEGEILTYIEVPIMEERLGAAYRKFSISEFPMAGVAVVLSLDEQLNYIIRARLVVAAANPVPTRLSTAEDLLIGQSILSILKKDVDWWVNTAEPDMDAVDDMDGSAEYKTQVVGSLLHQAIAEAIEDAKEVNGK